MERAIPFRRLIISLLFVLTGCKEFIEPSIQDRKVNLLAPAANTESIQYAQSFWWEPVEDALKYRLQVVSPNFTNTARLILDTLITPNRFNFTLDPGNYEWRVRAENGSSQTAYTTSNFIIYASSIKDQQVQLQVPANNSVTASGSQTFSWLKLYGAEQYHLEIDTNNFADEKVLFFDKTTPNLEYNVPLTRDKIYQWRVKALNDTAESKWSAIQNVTFDSTPPAQVTLTTPATGVAATSPVTLRWDAAATAARYQLVIYKSDQTTPYSSIFPVSLTTTSYTFTGVLGEKVYWQVRAIDAIGNVGAYSELRNFTVQ
ncbi:hypothetical protein SAMN06265348_103277 [Pedobacter westerhofensis]|uniref:Fibronectin type-III domain-containing protein n=1 Tax=Pedobacter westerhofensis TaxID=425512 RepID=A0A521C6S6_9SPHI|nr:hypothetical protein [Pedobacter westerhofensis]SMO55136.1 hypothetical protein SAMN06265348_103277 [Pedobacter westerhofensis]